MIEPMAKGSAKTHARSKKVRKGAGAYLDHRTLLEHSKPRPITIRYEDPEIVRQHIKDTARY